MKGYTSRTIIPETEQHMLETAAWLVGRLPESHVIRCHELARAVGRALDLPVQDGSFGVVDHSWLWLPPRASRERAPSDHDNRYFKWPNILDVYMPGAVPMVQIVYTGMPLPHAKAYMLGRERDDIDEETVEYLAAQLTSFQKEE